MKNKKIKKRSEIEENWVIEHVISLNMSFKYVLQKNLICYKSNNILIYMYQINLLCGKGVKNLCSMSI